MRLSKEALLAAARAAWRWPKGHGFHFTRDGGGEATADALLDHVVEVGR